MNISPVDWNTIPESIDLEVWNRLTGNFWLPEKVPVSNDIKSWKTLSAEERLATMRVFAGLTLLDTVQGVVGATNIIKAARTPHEEAVMLNIGFMEAVHAKSYSNIFMTLASTEEINAAFDWAKNNRSLQEKAVRIIDFYSGWDKALKGRAASVLLESFLFYSGFYLPLNFASQSKLTNTADIIKLIMRDEGVHGFYIGQKFQMEYREATKKTQRVIKKKVYTLAEELLELEYDYTEEIYGSIGWVPDIKPFLRYNLNKALSNLGFAGPFRDSAAKVKPSILAQMTLDTHEAHDFFSGSGASYVIAEAENTTDEDWEF